MLIPLYPYKAEKELLGDIDKLQKKSKKERRKLYAPDRMSPYAVDINDQAAMIIPGRGSVFGPGRPAAAAIAPRGADVETVPGTPLKQTVGVEDLPSVTSLFTSGLQTPAKPKVEIALDIPSAERKIGKLEAERDKLNKEIDSLPALDPKREKLINDLDKVFHDIKDVERQIEAEKTKSSTEKIHKGGRISLMTGKPTKPMKPISPERLVEEKKALKNLKALRDSLTVDLEKMDLMPEDIQKEQSFARGVLLTTRKDTDRKIKSKQSKVEAMSRALELPPTLPKKELEVGLKKLDVVKKLQDEISTKDAQIKSILDKLPESEKEQEESKKKVTALEKEIEDLRKEKERQEIVLNAKKIRADIVSSEIKRIRDTGGASLNYRLYNLDTGEITQLDTNRKEAAPKASNIIHGDKSIIKPNDLSPKGIINRENYIIYKPYEVDNRNEELMRYITNSLKTRGKIV